MSNLPMKASVEKKIVISCYEKRHNYAISSYIMSLTEVLKRKFADNSNYLGRERIALYSIGGKYKLELEAKEGMPAIIYTCTVIDEDEVSIKIIDRDGIERHIKKGKIAQSVRIDQNRMDSHARRPR